VNSGPKTFKSIIAEQLCKNKKLIDAGNGDSTSGSDDAPSEDNLNEDEIH
jgi:hypothetical protein